MNGVIEWVIGLMRVLGAPGVGIAIALETVFPPIPSEVVLPLAGFTASRGHYTTVSAIIWATIGSLVGAWLMYYLGRSLGAERLGNLADRMPLLDRRDIERANAWFERHGSAAVFFGRLVPGVRSLVSIPAGVARMNLAVFTGYTALGSLLFNAALILIGYELGAQYHLVEPYINRISAVVGAILALAAAWWIAKRIRRNRTAQAS